MSRRPIDDALAQARISPERAGFLWSTGLDTFGPGPDGPIGRSAGACFSVLARRFAHPRRMIAAACASATHAIGEAFQLVRSGRVPICVAGGATAMLTPFYIFGFAWLQALALDQAGDDPTTACRPFDWRRRGVALGEGGAALVLETLDGARARGAEPLAELRRIRGQPGRLRSQSPSPRRPGRRAVPAPNARGCRVLSSRHRRGECARHRNARRRSRRSRCAENGSSPTPGDGRPSRASRARSGTRWRPPGHWRPRWPFRPAERAWCRPPATCLSPTTIARSIMSSASLVPRGPVPCSLLRSGWAARTRRSSFRRRRRVPHESRSSRVVDV